MIRPVYIFGMIFLLMGSVSTGAQRKPADGRSRANLDPSTRDKIVRYVHERFPMSPTAKVIVGPFRSSAYPDFYETTIMVEDGKQKGSQTFFVSKNGRYLIQGNIYTLGANPRQEVQREISTANEPSVGPANAPVSIVEYADLQCPTCARMQEFLDRDVLPKYRGRVRLVFKEFPLVNVHDWALAAAVANECAFQISPSTFVTYRNAIFQHQSSINATNSRDELLSLAQQSGIDRVRLTACIDSKASIPRVEKDYREGQALGVSSTPTFFINGRMLTAGASPDQFYKAIDEALTH